MGYTIAVLILKENYEPKKKWEGRNFSLPCSILYE